MKTRTLVLLALACGLAILLAGGVQLVRIALQRDRANPVLPIGGRATVGGVDVTVLSAAAAGEVTDVRVLLEPRTSQVLDAGAGWGLVAAGSRRPQVPPASPGALPACQGLALPVGRSATCVLGFAGSKVEGIVSLERDDQRRAWSLQP